MRPGPAHWQLGHAMAWWRSGNWNAAGAIFMMTIGEVARASGLPTKTVRYYADIDLVSPGGRSEAGYR